MLRIRDLTAADLHRVARLEQGEPSAWNSGDIGRELNQGEGLRLVAVDEADDGIVGWCCSRSVEAEAELLKITVLGSCRRRGIASALLADLQDRLLGKAADPNRKHPLYNTSPYTFARLLGDAENIAPNLVPYINGFSPNVRAIMERFYRELDPTATASSEPSLRPSSRSVARET